MEGNLHMTTEPRQEPPGEEGPYARRMNRESSVSYMDCLFSVLVGSEQTDGRFGLMEMVAPKRAASPRAICTTPTTRASEGFYVLEGELTFYVGEKTYEASPGTFVFLPHGVAHSYTFETDSVRMLSIVAPGGLERHFRDPRFSEPAKGTTLPTPGEAPDPELLEAMAADLASYGTEVVGPPGPPREG
jgi:mannose-6-phosphate isomerase-like protein (cupin superfamily)